MTRARISGQKYCWKYVDYSGYKRQGLHLIIPLCPNELRLLNPYRGCSIHATPQASTGVTPNMMMLGQQTRLPVKAMYGTPLGPEEEETTVSEYVAALQGGLRAAYWHSRDGLQRAALHQKHDYDGKVQRREYQAGELVWIHVPWNQAAVPVVWSGTHHQSMGQRTGHRAPETRQAAHSGASGSPGGI